MIWYIILALFVVGSLVYKRDELFHGYDKGEEWFVFCFQTFCVAATGFIIGSLFSTYGPLHESEHYAYPLVAVDDGSKIQGASFLFSGYVDQSQVYNFYERTGPNTYQRGWQYAYNAPVVEDSPAGTANLTQYYLVPNKWLGFTYLTHLRNEFHVPLGSVVQEVSLDNK